jgi:hypothetical protein
MHPTLDPHQHPSPTIDWPRVRALVTLMLAGDLTALRELAEHATQAELEAAITISNELYAVGFQLSEVRP